MSVLTSVFPLEKFSESRFQEDERPIYVDANKPKVDPRYMLVQSRMRNVGFGFALL